MIRTRYVRLAGLLGILSALRYLRTARVSASDRIRYGYLGVLGLPWIGFGFLFAPQSPLFFVLLVGYLLFVVWLALPGGMMLAGKPKSPAVTG